MTGPGTSSGISGSFRDPDGLVFARDGVIYRQVNNSCAQDYDTLLRSGLYKELVGVGLLIPHEETDVEGAKPDICYKVLRPQKLPFISYPYEWCFSQLKAAALSMLDIQQRALERGMSLKDASAYNIQFMKCHPVLIDTLSFEAYRQTEPWNAYAQFCRHFLAPLALMSLKDVRLNQLSRVYIDGIPLDLASSLLPLKTRLKFSLMSHIHIHAKYQARFADKEIEAKGRGMDIASLKALIENLQGAVQSLDWDPGSGGWADYYNNTEYGLAGLEEKKQLVSEFLDAAGGKTAWDLGANTGLFSRVAASRGMETVSFDADASCVEKNWLGCVDDGKTRILPLLLDLTNPSPASGWENSERYSFMERGPADTALALALVHHLAIDNNVPLDRISEFFRRICSSLIIEFVPKSDPQVKKLLSLREDIFPLYSREGFEEAFSKNFIIRRSEGIKGTERTLYLMMKR